MSEATIVDSPIPEDVDGPSAEGPAATGRQFRILEAFEQCIVRAGFHRTTMQDVAKVAGMSAGNLYRYFSSKEALVSGLAERDKERFQGAMSHITGAPNFLAALKAMGHRHLVEEPRSRCVQFMELWAEGTRNAAVGAVSLAKDREVRTRMIGNFEAAKALGEIPPRVDTTALVTVMMAIGDGLFKRRAIDPSFDPEEGFRLLMAVLDAIVEGRVDLSKPADSRPDDTNSDKSA